jgi:salicylate hydroxylase
MSMKVLISGAGIGGLALAQSFARSSIAVELFERDSAIDSRAQGYRIRMDADGDSALRTCLLPDLYTLYQATSSVPTAPPAAAFNFQFEMVYQFPAAPAATAGAHLQLGMKSSPLGFASHVTVNRHTLRQILSADLQNSIRFGHAATRATQSADRATLHFANGATAEGDLIVAAEGIHSPLRIQLLPDAQILDLGMTCLYGRIPLTQELYDSLPDALHAGFTPILGPHRRTMGIGPFRKRRLFADAAAEIGPRIALDPIADYLMWILVVPRQQVPASTAANAVALLQLAIMLTDEWHPTLRALLAQADPSATFAIPIRSSQRITPWPASRITFLGDAIHAMTPAGGIGANTALRDAALLSYLLAHVESGTTTLTHAIEAYESEMRDYAFAAVERSLANAKGLYQLVAPPESHA